MAAPLQPSELMYLGGARMLVEQWQHLHAGLRAAAQQRRVPPEGYLAAADSFEQLFNVAQRHIASGPAMAIGDDLRATLQRWIARYRKAAQQSTADIGDFTIDADRLLQAIKELSQQPPIISGDRRN